MCCRRTSRDEAGEVERWRGGEVDWWGGTEPAIGNGGWKIERYGGKVECAGDGLKCGELSSRTFDATCCIVETCRCGHAIHHTLQLEHF